MITVAFQISGEENDYSINEVSTVFYSFGGKIRISTLYYIQK